MLSTTSTDKLQKAHLLDQQHHDDVINNSDACSLCKKTLPVFDAQTGEIVCTNCGMVMQENIESLDKEWRTYSFENINIKQRTGLPSSLALHDMGLSTVISYSNADVYGAAINPEQISKIQRLRKWNSISSVNNRSRSRNLKNAFEIMSRIKDRLSLSDSVIEKAAYFYRKALEKRLTKGRSIGGMVVASTYAACRQIAIPRKLDELAAAVNSDPVFAGKCYRLLLRHLKIQNLPAVDSSSYLSKIANKANVSQKTYRKALEMLATVKENPISFGKDPNALAVAVLYAACMKEGENVSQARIVVAGDSSIVTLRKRFADVKKVFP
jgi:transcription initiation factor TFIIB